MVRVALYKGTGVRLGCDLEARIPSDTDRVVRDASVPEIGSPMLS